MHTLADDDTYEKAVRTLADANRVVLYCAAGVTLSRTGLGWKDLVTELAEKMQPAMKSASVPDSKVAETIIETIRNSADTPLRDSSLLYAILEKIENDGTKLSAQDRLQDHLTTILYQNRRPKSDRNKNSVLSKTDVNASGSFELLRYVCNAAAMLTSIGKEVIIVTTNYDVYIEDELSIALQAYQPDKSLNFHVISSKEDTNTYRENWPKAGEIPLIYLHGRLPRKDSRQKQHGKDVVNGEVVLSETQYASAEPEVSAWLDFATSGADCLLILGSSMEDRPLLHLLHKNKERSLKPEIENTHPTANATAPPCKSVILLKSFDPRIADSERYSEEEKETQALLNWCRFESAGVDYYLPMQTFSDVPIFLRDSLVWIQKETTTGNNSDPSTTFKDTLSAKQLENWCKELAPVFDTKEAQEKFQEILSKHEAAVLKTLGIVFSDAKALPERERLFIKIEFWLRGITPYAGDITRVVRVADSASINLNPLIRRSEYLYWRFAARTAAVRAMQYGAVRLEPLNRFGEKASASRWQGYYTVPITHTLGQRHSMIVGSMVVCIGLAGESGKTISSRQRESFQVKISETSQALRANRGSIHSSSAQLSSTVISIGRELLRTAEELRQAKASH